jgi:hypothetical protein
LGRTIKDYYRPGVNGYFIAFDGKTTIIERGLDYQKKVSFSHDYQKQRIK